MKFELNNELYEIQFSRADTSTIAELAKYDPQSGTFIETNLIGVANLNPKDRMVKSIGRKVALSKLLKRMGEISAGNIEPEFSLSKEDKTNIWKAYFDYIGGAK